MSQLDRKRRFGWWFDSDTERVWNPQGKRGGGPIITDREGNIEDRFIERFQRKVGEGRGGLWGRLGPVEIDGIEIRQNTKIWHDEREEWLRAVEIDVSRDPEPIITFKVDGSWPETYIKYYGSDLEDLRQQDVIESQKEVNDRAEQALEELRAHN